MKKSFLTIILSGIIFIGFSQTILMNNNNPETITCGNTYNFYDAGGVTGQYSFGFGATYTKTFTPSVPSQKIRIDFSSFDVENYFAVYMQIFDGPNVNSPLIGQYSANNTPGTVVSTATGGELTVLFTHDAFQGGYQGWDAQISCIAALVAPINDNPCGATMLSVTTNPLNITSGSLIGATNSTNGSTIFDPSCSIYNNGPDVWFKAIVPASGNIAFITYDSTIYDTGIEVYNPSTCSTLNFGDLINCDDNSNTNSLFGTMSRIALSQQTPGDTLYLRVWKNFGGMGLFNVAAFEFIPSVEVLYPNGGEVLLQNDYILIDFTTLGVDTVDIEFSDDNGASWTLEQQFWPVANGYYYWTVPAITSTTCLIRVSKTGNPSIFDISDGTFTISEPYIEVFEPNGGEIYASGQQGVDIQWNSPGYWGDINILFSDNNGASWTTLASNILNYGSWNIDFPSVVSTQCLIKVENSNDANMFDVSNSTFTLTNTPPSITILNPVGGEVFTEGQTINIMWTASGFTSVNIYFTDGDGGGTIATNVPANQNIYVWQIPTGYLLGQFWQIIIEPVNSPWFSQNSNYFTVQSSTPSIEVLTPGLSQTFYIGNTEIIQWNSSQVNQVNIEYSADFGSTWNTIANNVSGNIYFWNVNTPVVPNALIRIYASNNINLVDTSDFFLILNATGNSIIDASYSGASSICAGDTIDVDVSAIGGINFTNFYVLQLSDANGSFANPINIGYKYSYFYTETITGIIPDTVSTSANYKLRIKASDYPGISDTININISAKPLFNFTANPLVNYLPVSGLINFTFNGNTSSITSYNWNFGDGGNATTQNPTHNYTSPGFYSVSLTASNAACSHTVTKPFYVTIEELFDTDTILTLTTQDILGLAFVNPAKGCFALANGNCLITQDSGLTFTTVPVGLTTALTSASLVPGYWLVTSSGGNIAASTNGGTTWNIQNVGTSDSLFASAFLDNTNGYVVGNNGVIFKFNGSNWAQQTSGTTNSLRGIAFSDTDITTVGYNGTILRSSGNGTWGPITSPYNSHYRGVAFNDAGVGLAVGDLGRIIRTTNHGLTWSPALSGVPVNFTSVAISGDSAWAVGNGGIIYKSFDAGITWIRNSIGVQNDLNAITFYGEEQLRRMGIDETQRAQSNNRGYVVGKGGVARLFGNPIDTTGNSTDIIELSNFNVLFKVYPVPAINDITIEGKLKQEGLLNITLKDMYGATVKVINAQKENGNIIKRISVSDLASGIYFIHIDSPEQQSVHRIVVSK
jgi:PKD repeat protein